MRLYIVRHAIAVPHGTRGVAENDRPLTPDGIRKMKQAAAGLEQLEVAPRTILSSPLPRAWQTAEIIAKVLGSKINLKELQALSPSGKRPDVYKAIEASKDEDELMLVGHQPSLGEIAGEIAWGSSDCYVELKKGGGCAIDLETLTPQPRGAMVWLLTPSILRDLAG
jgi:phosphohistidine phosphatase